MASYKSGLIVTGNADGAVKAVKLTKEQLKQLNTTQKAGQKTAKDYAMEVRSLTNKFGSYASLLGGAVIAAGLAMVKNQLSQIDTLGKTADKLGLTTQALTEMRYAAELTGVDSKKLDMALQRMTRRVSEAAQGTGEAKNALKELGVSAQELNKLSPDEMFKKVADAMQNVDNQGDRVRLAFKLFDSEGVDLVNTLNLGSEGFDDIARKAEIAGIALTRIEANKVEQANDAILDGQKLFDGFAKQLTVAVAPALTDISKRLFGVAEEHGGMAKMAEKAWSFVLDAVGVVADAIRGFEIIFGVLETALYGLATYWIKTWDRMFSAVADVANLIPGIDLDYENSGFAKFTRELEEDFEQTKQRLHDKAMEEIPSVAIKKWNEEVTQQAEEAADNMVGATETMSFTVENFGGVLEDSSEKTETLTKETTKLKEQADPFAEAWRKATNRIDESFADAWEGAFDSFSSFTDSLLDSFKRLLAEMAHLAITKPIVLNLMGSIGGAFGISGTANALGSAGDLLSGGSGVLDLFGFGGNSGSGVLDLFSGGGSGFLNNTLTWIDNGISGFIQGAGNLLGDFGLESIGNSVGDFGAGLLDGSAGSSLSTVAPYLALGDALRRVFETGLPSIVSYAKDSGINKLTGGNLFGTGWKTDDAGLQFGVNNGVFFGNTFSDLSKKKSFFRGTKRKTETGDLDQDIYNNLDSALDETQALILSSFKAIGMEVSDDVFNTFTRATQKLSTKDKSEEEIQTMIEEWFDSVANAMTRHAQGGGVAGQMAVEDFGDAPRGYYNRVLEQSGATEPLLTFDQLMDQAAEAFAEANTMADDFTVRLLEVSQSFNVAATEAQNAFNEIMNAVLGARQTVSGNILAINRLGVNWDEAAYLQSQAAQLRGRLDGADEQTSASIINNLSNVLTSLYREQRQNIIDTGLEGDELNQQLIELEKKSLDEQSQLDEMLAKIQEDATENLESTMASLEQTYTEESEKLIKEMEENRRVLELVPEKLEALTALLEASNSNVADVIGNFQNALVTLQSEQTEAMENLAENIDKGNRTTPYAPAIPEM